MWDLGHIYTVLLSCCCCFLLSLCVCSWQFNSKLAWRKTCQFWQYTEKDSGSPVWTICQLLCPPSFLGKQWSITIFLWTTLTTRLCIFYLKWLKTQGNVEMMQWWSIGFIGTEGKELFVCAFQSALTHGNFQDIPLHLSWQDFWKWFAVACFRGLRESLIDLRTPSYCPRWD